MELDVRLATGSDAEAQARDELRTILANHDLKPWTFTTDVVVEEGTQPRSHPVLTLSTANRGSIQLASYVHEQMHWFCTTRREAVEALCAGELRRRYPTVPVGAPDGAPDERSTYLHLIVCWLELDALRRLIGTDAGDEVVRHFASAGVYRWVYDKVQEDFDSLGQIFRDNQVAIDPLRGEPDFTQRTAADWEDAYHLPLQPWDIGRPHAAVSRLLAADALTGHVLDAGCGTGEDAFAIAERGIQTCGIDVAPTAIERAKVKACERGLSVRLVAGDLTTFGHLGPTFNSVLDIGLFHSLGNDLRRQYVQTLSSLTLPGGIVYLLCFSEFVPGAGGPRRFSKADIRAEFGADWRIIQIAPERYETRFETVGVAAWLARIERLGEETKQQ